MKKKERRAYDRAIAQYTAELNKVKPVQEIKRVDNNSKRTIEEELGNSASGRLNYLSRKADSVARTINKDDDYKAKVGKFNERYDIMRKQLSGQYVTRYGVLDNFDQNSTINPKPVNFEQTFASRDEAYKEAQKRADAYNNDASNFNPRVELRHNGWGMASTTVVNSKLTPETYLQEVQYKGGRSGRTERFEALDGAYQDMARLSKSIQGSAGNQNISLYSSLADKLKTQYKRDAGNVTNTAKPTGLLASELAGNPLAGEVIA